MGSLLTCTAASSSQRAFPKVHIDEVGDQLLSSLRRTAERYGLILPELNDQSAMPNGDASGSSSEHEISKLVQRVREVHKRCTAPLFIPLALASWSKQMLSQGRNSMNQDRQTEAAVEYEDASECLQESRCTDQEFTPWIALLRAFASFAAEVEAEADADAMRAAAEADSRVVLCAGKSDSEVFRSLSGLESREHLTLRARLALLRRTFLRVDANASSAVEASSASAVCELLGTS